MTADETIDRIRTVHDRCEEAVREQQWQVALDGFSELLPLLEDAGDTLGTGRVRLRMGQLCEELNEPDSAATHYRNALELGKQLGEPQLQAAALHRMGHLMRMRDPAGARRLFQQCLELHSSDQEAGALSLAMIGQIDFTSGDEMGGLDCMLQALTQLPPGAPTHDHLVEHIVYFGSKVDRKDYLRAVHRRIQTTTLKTRLIE